jgi:hypothetical protein
MPNDGSSALKSTASKIEGSRTAVPSVTCVRRCVFSPEQRCRSHHAPSSHQRSKIAWVAWGDLSCRCIHPALQAQQPCESHAMARVPSKPLTPRKTAFSFFPAARLIATSTTRPPRPSPRACLVTLVTECPLTASRLENKRLSDATCPVDLLGQHLQLLRTAKSRQGDADVRLDSTRRTRQGVSVACTSKMLRV